MNTTVGIDIRYRVENGEVIVERSNLSDEDTAMVLGSCVPLWAIEAMDKSRKGSGNA